ncbi:DNA-binding protein [Aureimonas endophytica]|uniref:DNA-binding protein n=1 Tax=Aureimonas endophytica TaxID=2027858 RepID=A0A917A152_9HYPH|nr:RNA-binding protein [Aureimonas endophytica]GGE21957.1 DNA-binding protein [Aureimonas endophytica]
MADDDEMNPRMCIVSRQSFETDRLIRFVASPDGQVVPDLKRRLPGRGVHVEARREVVELAVRRKLFGRALKAEARAGEDLPDVVDAVLKRAALGFLGLARKAGSVVSGASRVDAAVRAGAALAVIHAEDAAADGIRKIDAARFAAAAIEETEEIPAFRPASSDELGLAIGGDNVIHAAVLAGEAGAALLKRLEALANYRGVCPGRSPRLGQAVRDDDGRRIPDEDPGMDDGLGSDPAQEAEL